MYMYICVCVCVCVYVCVCMCRRCIHNIYIYIYIYIYTCVGDSVRYGEKDRERESIMCACVFSCREWVPAYGVIVQAAPACIYVHACE